MQPLLILTGITLGLKLLGRSGRVPALDNWPVALRGGVSTMFLITGTSHFTGKREEMVQMIPPGLPNPEALMTLTGLAELAGAAALWIPATRPYAAAGLSALLIGVFPANVYHATHHPDLTTGQQLIPRTLIQLVFLTATSYLLVNERHREHPGHH